MQHVDGFEIDRHEVTIGQFRRFAEATGLATTAEKAGGGFQFRAGWERMAGWTWRTPFGQPGADPSHRDRIDGAHLYHNAPSRQAFGQAVGT
jgi:formylglycine-generating enzyme required for sulfatase activity